MDKYFQPACNIVFPEEGPYSLQPGDTGGETKWGTARKKHPEITDAQWATWNKDCSLKLFYDQYWVPARCGEMNWRWALGVFDGQINQGSVTKLAQRALRLPRIDGIVGDATLAAMLNSTDWHFANFMALRLKAYIPLPLFSVDGDGWFTRVANIAYYAGKGPNDEGNI